jgi:hypothetical protein
MTDVTTCGRFQKFRESPNGGRLKAHLLAFRFFQLNYLITAYIGDSKYYQFAWGSRHSGSDLKHVKKNLFLGTLNESNSHRHTQ